ncbi:MAG: hypothetical protein R3325_12620 [Thermoanaerobaculia bacterium]|nr:hypothetical protein [Thermoanaerobaculia bacterium]
MLQRRVSGGSAARRATSLWTLLLLGVATVASGDSGVGPAGDAPPPPGEESAAWRALAWPDPPGDGVDRIGLTVEGPTLLTRPAPPPTGADLLVAWEVRSAGSVDVWAWEVKAGRWIRRADFSAFDTGRHSHVAFLPSDGPAPISLVRWPRADLYEPDPMDPPADEEDLEDIQPPPDPPLSAFRLSEDEQPPRFEDCRERATREVHAKGIVRRAIGVAGLDAETAESLLRELRWSVRVDAEENAKSLLAWKLVGIELYSSCPPGCPDVYLRTGPVWTRYNVDESYSRVVTPPHPDDPQVTLTGWHNETEAKVEVEISCSARF